MNPQFNEDEDYDPFAQWRPGTITIDDNVSDEFDGEDVTNDVDELREFRPREEEVAKEKTRKREQASPSLGKMVKDVAKQGPKELLIGAGGTWGDLLELAGVQQKESPGQTEKRKREFDVLTKMQDPDYKPTLYDISVLSDDDDVIPEPSGLPTSKSLRELNELLGGPGKAETQAGRLAGRTFRIFGSGLAFGQVAPIPAAAAGVAGQTVEELGGGPLLQAGAEIAALLTSPGAVGKKLVESTKKEVKKRVNNLRNIGFTDEQITLAINSGSRGKSLGVKASKGPKIERAFEEAIERSDELISDILTQSVTGIEKGPQHVHKLASDVYGSVAREAENLIIRDSTPFINSATKVVRELRKNLGTNPEATSFLNRIFDSVIASTKQPTARNFMEFYKELNGLGRWLGRSQKDRLINIVKNGIKDTFKSEGRQGRELAAKFEEANKGVKRAFDAEEMYDLIQKATTQDGINYPKLNKIFDKTDNVKLFEEVLGKQQASNFRQIANTAKDISNFDKSWKAMHALDPSIGNVGGAGYLLFNQNWKGLAVALGIKASEASVRKLAELSLTNPRFQNLMLRGVHSIKNQSPKALIRVLDAMQKELDDEGIDIKINRTKEKDKQ